MSETQSWYQRKISQARGQPAQPQRYPPMGPSPQQPSYVQNQPQYDRGTQQVQPVQPEQVTVQNLYEAAGQWRGGPGARANPDPCPQCGSNQYFSRANGSKRGPSPAPHCYNCGFNDGMFEQGLATSWGA